jgi:hypothetical protein
LILDWRWASAALGIAVALGCGGGEPGARADGGGADGSATGDTEDVDTESGTVADGECPGFPASPHGWDLDHPLPLVTFPALHGSGGPVTELEVCRLFEERDTTRSLVFAVGAPS